MIANQIHSEVVELATPAEYGPSWLKMRPGATFEEWADTGATLGRMERSVMWWIGDWLNAGEAAWGERYAQALDSTGLDYDTLAQAKWVTGKLKVCTRVQNLSFSHHRLVAPLEQSEQEYFLEMAQPLPGESTPQLSVRELQAAIRDFTRGIAAPPLLPSGVYAVIYADPPWRYDFSPTDSRRIENQYPTMATEDIAALEVPVADDAVLFMWATNPKLHEAFTVLAGWGFTYVTNMVWVKDRIGMGYYARSRHELLLIAKRGNLPVPLPANRPDSVITGDRGEHSAKPLHVYQLIESMYPDCPKLELFSRSAQAGWSAWGNQA